MSACCKSEEGGDNSGGGGGGGGGCCQSDDKAAAAATTSPAYQGDGSLPPKTFASTASTVQHVVLITLAADAPVAAIRAKVEAMRTIPGILAVSFGKNYTKRSPTFTHALFIQFVDAAAEVAYQTHPAHVATRDLLLKHKTGKLVCALDWHDVVSGNTRVTKNIGLVAMALVGVASFAAGFFFNKACR
jgi:hypothetical protein